MLKYRALSLQVCLVDADSGKIEPPEELPSFPHGDELIAEIEELCATYQISQTQDKQTDGDSDSGKNCCQ